MVIAKVVALFCLLLFPSPDAYGDETYSVSGEVLFPNAELIVISLYSPERFKNCRNRPLPPPPFSQILEVNPEQRKAGRVRFTFPRIPTGTYGILAFRDKTAHRIIEQHGFKETLSGYTVNAFSANWEDIKIEVDRDITGIKIQF
ncbi:MAG: hypothetical protein P8175_02305 [Deltaproteobacteria bacterium]